MNQSIHSIDRDELVDISTVRIDPSLPKEQRIREYIRQVKNPYCYLDSGVVVHIRFTQTDTTLEDQLLSYLKRIT